MNKDKTITYIKNHRPAINTQTLEQLSVQALTMIEIQVYLETLNKTKNYN